jgi:hypothetical protein
MRVWRPCYQRKSGGYPGEAGLGAWRRRSSGGQRRGAGREAGIGATGNVRYYAYIIWPRRAAPSSDGARDRAAGTLTLHQQGF